MSGPDLERLETKLAYLERANQELSDVVFGQQKALDELARRVARLADRVQALEAAGPGEPVGDERPPHY